MCILKIVAYRLDIGIFYYIFIGWEMRSLSCMDDIGSHIRDFCMDLSICSTVWTGDIEMDLSITRLSDDDGVLIYFLITVLADILSDSRIDDGFEYWVEHGFWL